ncbi:MAG: NAD(P)H-dependent oxidoreductase subunit E [Bacteroidales bacterium]
MASAPMIKVCVGTACHVKGARQVYDSIKRELKLERTGYLRRWNTRWKDRFLGCCTLAPVVQIDDVTYGHVTTSQAGDIIADFEAQQGKKGGKKFRLADGREVQEVRSASGWVPVAWPAAATEIRNAVQDTIDRNSLNVKLKHVGCVGMCRRFRW